MMIFKHNYTHTMILWGGGGEGVLLYLTSDINIKWYTNGAFPYLSMEYWLLLHNISLYVMSLKKGCYGAFTLKKTTLEYLQLSPFVFYDLEKNAYNKTIPYI